MLKTSILAYLSMATLFWIMSGFAIGTPNFETLFTVALILTLISSVLIGVAKLKRK